ncbi:MAG: toxin HicA [Coriobacteriia bacterium]|nr:toxin HicA [Coriobacteriia bacterium]
MAQIDKIVQAMRASRANVRFSDGIKVGTHYFGKCRIAGSHYIFKTPWTDDAWINMQNDRGKMKPYQVKQLLDAIDKLEGEADA